MLEKCWKKGRMFFFAVTNHQRKSNINRPLALNVAKPGLQDVKDQAGPFSEVNTFSSQL